MDFAVERLSSQPRDAVLNVMRGSFDRPFTDDFFEWKHVEGPWGPTDGWVAIDDSGMVGVLCCLPWRLAHGAVERTTSRLVDGGTLPRALRRGIFGELVRHEVERCKAAGESIFCTATPAAQASHVKRGARALSPLRHGIGVPPLLRARASVRFDDAVEHYLATPADRVRTAWTAAALRWRMDPRSGRRYECARLAEADHPNGVIFRVGTRRGIRECFVTVAWGTPREVATLLAAVALRRGALVWAGTTGPGAGRMFRPLMQRGESLVCTWSFDTDLPEIADVGQLEFWLADVEGTI